MRGLGVQGYRLVGVGSIEFLGVPRIKNWGSILGEVPEIRIIVYRGKEVGPLFTLVMEQFSSVGPSELLTAHQRSQEPQLVDPCTSQHDETLNEFMM